MLKLEPRKATRVLFPAECIADNADADARKTEFARFGVGDTMPTDLDAKTCQWTNEAQALAAFAEFIGKTQSASHIKPLHWYVACRLVLEGGFSPDDITPRPPFRVQRRSCASPNSPLSIPPLPAEVSARFWAA